MFDVAVIGLGAVGSMATWSLARRGAKVVGLERFGPAHGRGSSHGGSRIFRRTLFEGQHYVPLIDAAATLWRELEQESKAQLFIRSGGLCIGPDRSSLIRRALESADLGGFEHELLTGDILASRYPQHAVIDGDVAVFEPGAGVLNPERCILAAQECAASRGADLRFHNVVKRVQPKADHVLINVGHETLQARRVILAAGAWISEFTKDLGLELPLAIQRSPLVWFSGPRRADYIPNVFPTFIRKSTGIDGWGIPDTDGKGVKIGAGPSSPKPYLRKADENIRPIDSLDTFGAEQVCGAAFPDLNPRAVSAQPCMNSRTPDREFVIGISSRQPRVVLAGGFSGHGFKHAPASGAIAADLALENESTVPCFDFNPDRYIG